MDVRSRLLPVITATLLAVGVACGGGSQPAQTEAAKPAPEAAPAPAPEAAPAPAETAAPATDAAAAPADAAAAATTTAAGDIPAAAVEEAEKVFTQRCSQCHGMSGKGDGPAAAALNPKPRDYSDKAWQASVQDADIEKVIVQGGPSMGKSALMAANPDLADKPDVVRALRVKVRSFAGM